MAKKPDLKLQRSTLTDCGGALHVELIYAAKQGDDYSGDSAVVIVRLPVEKNGNPKLRDAELEALGCARELIRSEVERLKNGGR